MSRQNNFARPDVTPLAVPHGQLIDDLQRDGWAQQAQFLPPALTRSLGTECIALSTGARMHAAGVGSRQHRLLQPAIRGDRIAWLQDGLSPACDSYLNTMHGVQQALNRSLYLGLEQFETHFAFYPPGAGYLPHRDRFRDDDRRTVSAVLYLNRRWMPDQGGALRLHPHGGAARDISPDGGRLVLFLSAEMLHEVLPASRDRYSLAGWFRRRD